MQLGRMPIKTSLLGWLREIVMCCLRGTHAEKRTGGDCAAQKHHRRPHTGVDGLADDRPGRHGAAPGLQACLCSM